MTSVNYRGLTHECQDEDCHVIGFVQTLKDKEQLRREQLMDALEQLDEVTGMSQ